MFIKLLFFWYLLGTPIIINSLITQITFKYIKKLFKKYLQSGVFFIKQKEIVLRPHRDYNFLCKCLV